MCLRECGVLHPAIAKTLKWGVQLVLITYQLHNVLLLSLPHSPPLHQLFRIHEVRVCAILLALSLFNEPGYFAPL